MAKYKLRKDYTNWWAVAGDALGGRQGLSTEQAQRYFGQLKSLNPGVTRFTRGTTIKLPNVSSSRQPVLSDARVAYERRQYDFQQGRPSDDYYRDTGRITTQQSAPQQTAFQQTTAQAPAQDPYARRRYTYQNDYIPRNAGELERQPVQPPEGFQGVAPVERSRKFGAARRQEMVENVRYVPKRPDEFTTRGQLPRENYEYFYGQNPQREAEQRNLAQREQERLRRDAFSNAARRAQAPADPQSGAYQRFYEPGLQSQVKSTALTKTARQAPMATMTANEAQQLIREYYAGRTDLTPEELAAANFAVANEANEAYVESQRRSPYTPDYGTTLKSGQKQIPDTKSPSKQIQDNLAIQEQVQAPYTTDWLANWQPENISEEDLYMLYVVGAVEPDEFVATTAGGGSGSSWYGGGYSPRRGSSGRSYTPSNYVSPQRDYGQRNYAADMGLVSWRI